MFAQARIMERMLQSLYNTACSKFEYRVSVMSPQGLKMGVRDTVAEGATMEQLMVTSTSKGSAAEKRHPTPKVNDTITISF